MILDRLDIRRISYGDNEGSYKATIKFDDESKGNVTLIMSPELSDELLRHCGSAIKEFSQKASEELADSIENSIKSVEQISI